MLSTTIPRPRVSAPLHGAPRRLRELLFPWLRPARGADRRVPAAVPVTVSTGGVALRNATAVFAPAAAIRRLTDSDRGLLSYLIERALLPWMH